MPKFESFQEKLNSFDSSLPIDSAWMLPASWYTDSDFLALEKELVFKKSWQPVALLSQLEEENSYVTGVTADIPWVITRGPEGELRAFYNICRHKGREVVRGCGKAERGELVCGYHAWKFNTEGKLKSAPKMGGVKNFNLDEMSLVPLAVEAWGNWAFINGDLNAEPLSRQLKELNKRFDERSIEKYKFHSTKEWIINCNWKVFNDNYLDGGYHIPFMHPSLDAQIDMENYKTECFENYNIQSSPANQKNGELSYDHKERIGDGSIYAWVYPNFTLNLYGNCLDSNYVTPLGEDKCHVRYEFYFTEDCSEEFIENSIAQSDVTQVEDIEICESVQVGLKSGAYTAGRYAPQLEVGEYHFHQLLAKNLRQ
ncbi:MAG: aromatic ring-hydroxylating dioxygenase subunit alpha [Halobacteriovoraceae bacterium]|nr:aromatic ring-hydroxylating dioxygenase subunit alpha [Halobacteriovoraceae bacterium]